MGFFTPPHRFSAIRCAAAVPRTPPDAPQVPEPVQSPQRQRDPDAAVNGHRVQAAKPPPQQHKGIMGMFAAKAAARPQDTPKEAKAEAKEAAGVSYFSPLVCGFNDPLAHRLRDLSHPCAAPPAKPTSHWQCSGILWKCLIVCSHLGQKPLMPHSGSLHIAIALTFPNEPGLGQV